MRWKAASSPKNSRNRTGKFLGILVGVVAKDSSGNLFSKGLGEEALMGEEFCAFYMRAQ